MPRIANEADFHQGGLYDNYAEFPFHASRAEWIGTSYPAVGKIIVVGCAYGYLVKHLRLLGLQAWGFDLSQFAIDRIAPEAAPYCMFADVARQQDRRNVKQMAGIASNGRFNLAVTEDVLPCLTDNEAGVLVNVAQQDAVNVLHIVTAIHPEVPGDVESRFADLNWKTGVDWRALVNTAGGSGHRILDAETWGEW